MNTQDLSMDDFMVDDIPRIYSEIRSQLPGPAFPDVADC
jgi:hypothetical protein